MAVHSYSIEINAINIYKFGSLKAGIPTVPDKKNSLNIYPQVREVTLYESIFSSVMRCEIALVDYIGLINNFPLSGEEIVIIEYKNVGDDTIRRWVLAIEDITDITPDPKNRAIGAVLKCISIEALANNLGTVQQAYKGTVIQIAKQIFDEHITNRVYEFYPSYRSPNMFAEDNETRSSTIVVPNMHPIAAIDAVQSLAVSENKERYTYFFYQNIAGFNFRTLQGLTQGINARRHAFKNKYIYLSDEISEKTSDMNNKERVVSNLAFDKRLSSMQKLSTGYFNNNLFEINIAQKAIHQTRTTVDDLTAIEKFHLNTTPYENYAKSFNGGEEEQSNRTKYAIMTQAENQTDFPVLRLSERWGKDLISKIAMGQIDITAVIPGTNRFVAGDLFYLEIPEFHGFNEVKADDLISGYFLITDIKHIVRIGGFQTTVLKLNKDSLKSSLDRNSRY